MIARLIPEGRHNDRPAHPGGTAQLSPGSSRRDGTMIVRLIPEGRHNDSPAVAPATPGNPANHGIDPEVGRTSFAVSLPRAKPHGCCIAMIRHRERSEGRTGGRRRSGQRSPLHRCKDHLLSCRFVEGDPLAKVSPKRA